ncbi:hypothetical protein PV721_37810 [Streptomyces sp. MB09-01]|uniref:zinc finger domain-containing protein n=1 Tax=Streptomyces sp. MB09-01 TaxID=3028666 RepID=UPI0029ADFCB9|nr:hypothetical protein [Streptomyces sp. MB09-01]MDX3539974.1 hypothetical protein [Streptomyces sp. MB09-01]
MLPLEAIELDAFRQRHENDTFWCGLLLGGCGVRLATKLYTDRVCHFAHHPGAEAVGHECRRRARGVSSADHLYVKVAAVAWLRDHGEQAVFDFARPGRAAIGSVLDIRFKSRGLRVHLDREVAPVWDEDGIEPVLGVSVPVDEATLVRHWYVHRIRLDSEGTHRRVRIGTEAFARGVEWFALDECEMTERGLSTPAVKQIVSSRRARPASSWTVAKVRKEPNASVRAVGLLRRLADARKVESVVVVARVCDEIEALIEVHGETREQLAVVVDDARRWLHAQADVRRDLFSQLGEALSAEDTSRVRQLLIRANATASHDRTVKETRVAEAADTHLVASGAGLQMLNLHQQRQAAEKKAAQRVRRTLERLAGLRRRTPVNAVRRLVRGLSDAADDAGGLLSPDELSKVSEWRARAGLESPDGTVPAVLAPAQPRSDTAPKKSVPRHGQVARRFWINEQCPRCFAVAGKDCVNDDRSGRKRVRPSPHDERVQPILDARAAQVQRRRVSSMPPGSPTVLAVACPDCGSAAGEACRSPRGSHRGRVERAAGHT